MLLFPQQTIILIYCCIEQKTEVTTILRKYSPTSLLTVQKKHLTSITVVDLDLKVTGTN